MLGKIELTTLENGARVVTSAMPGVESFSFGICAGVGSRHETSATAGYAHFLEHLLFKGSEKRRSTRAISSAVERYGGSMNAYTALENTFFHAVAPADSARLVADVVGDMYASPLIPDREVDRERLVVLEEMKSYHDDDTSFAFEQAQSALWPDHPVGRPILGTAGSLARATPETLRAWRRARYRAQDTIFAAAGRLDHDRVVDSVRPFAERLSAGRVPPPKPAASARAITPLVFERRETQQVQIVLGFRAPDFRSPRRHAVALLSHVLGHGMTSRLFMTIREKHGLAYAVSSEYSGYSDTGAFYVWLAVNPEKAVRAMRLCVRELHGIASEPAGRAEFSRAVDFLTGQLRLGAESSPSQLGWIADKLRRFGRVETPDEIVAGLRAVTPDVMRELAKELFQPANACISLVMPQKGAGSPEEYAAALGALV